MTETTRAALDLISSEIYVAQVVLDSDEMAATGDDELRMIERAIREAGGRCEMDADGDLRIVSTTPGELWVAARKWEMQGGRFAVTAREVAEIAHEYGVSYASVEATADRHNIPVIA